MVPSNVPRPGGQLHPPQVAESNARHTIEMQEANEGNQLRNLNRELDHGVPLDYWWIDAGWYPFTTGWPDAGAWEPDAARFPHGFAPIFKRARARGEDPGVVRAGAGAAWNVARQERSEKGEGMVQAFRRPESPFETARFRLRGLEAQVTYLIGDLDGGQEAAVRGAELMEEGVPVTIAPVPGAALIAYRRK